MSVNIVQPQATPIATMAKNAKKIAHASRQLWKSKPAEKITVEPHIKGVVEVKGDAPTSLEMLANLARRRAAAITQIRKGEVARKFNDQTFSEDSEKVAQPITARLQKIPEAIQKEIAPITTRLKAIEANTGTAKLLSQSIGEYSASEGTSASEQAEPQSSSEKGESHTTKDLGVYQKFNEYGIQAIAEMDENEIVEFAAVLPIPDERKKYLLSDKQTNSDDWPNAVFRQAYDYKGKHLNRHNEWERFSQNVKRVREEKQPHTHSDTESKSYSLRSHHGKVTRGSGLKQFTGTMAPCPLAGSQKNISEDDLETKKNRYMLIASAVNAGNTPLGKAAYMEAAGILNWFFENGFMDSKDYEEEMQELMSYLST